MRSRGRVVRCMDSAVEESRVTKMVFFNTTFFYGVISTIRSSVSKALYPTVVSLDASDVSNAAGGFFWGFMAWLVVFLVRITTTCMQYAIL